MKDEKMASIMVLYLLSILGLGGMGQKLLEQKDHQAQKPEGNQGSPHAHHDHGQAEV
jgi:hypothetical protein